MNLHENLHKNLHGLLKSGKSVYKLADETIVYSDTFISHSCRHLKYIFYTLDGTKNLFSLGNLAIDITSEYLNASLQPITIPQSYECVPGATPLNPKASFVGFGCGSIQSIQNIQFYKYFYSLSSDIVTTISNLKILKNPNTYLLYRDKKYSDSNPNLNINLYPISTIKLSSNEIAHYFTIVDNSNDNKPTYDIHAFIPNNKALFTASDSSGTTYTVTVELRANPNNPEKWADVNSTSKLNNIYNISVEPSFSNVAGRKFASNDFYPKWMLSGDLWYYYGGFGYFFNNLVEPFSNIIINIDKNVVLPFGITSTFFKEISNASLGLGVSGLLGTSGFKDIIWNTEFNKSQNTDQMNNNNDNLSQYFVTTDDKGNKYDLWSYFQSLPIRKAKSITINGGIISGHFLKTSYNPCSTTCSQQDYWTDLANSRADNVPANYRVRMSDKTYYKDWQNMYKTQFIRAVEYWIYSGLLELYSDNITLNRVTVLDGWMRGISPVQLNAYNLDYDKPNGKLSKIDPNGRTTITNCQFCLFNNCQVDGLDILSNNVTYKNVYFQASDDVLKLSSSYISADNITIISGNCGGAINLGSYGSNQQPLNNISIQNIYVHGHFKKSTDRAPGVSDIKTPTLGQWPGSAIITAYNLGGAIFNRHTNCKINISNLSVFNNDHLNKNYWLVNKVQGYMVEPGNFLTGEYINNSSYSLTINFNNVWYKYLTTTGDIQIDTCSNVYLNSYLYIPSKLSYSNLTFNGIYDILSSFTPADTYTKGTYLGWDYYPYNKINSRNLNNFGQDSQYTLFQGYNGKKTGPTPSPNMQWHQQWIGPNTNTNNTILFKSSCQNGVCNKCLDLRDGSTANGTAIQIWDCNGTPNQQWVYDKESGEIRYLSESTKCVDIPGGNSSNGTKLWIYDCNGEQQQQWEGSGNYQWKSKLENYSKCIDLNGGNMSNGTQLQIYDCQ